MSFPCPKEEMRGLPLLNTNVTIYKFSSSNGTASGLTSNLTKIHDKFSWHLMLSENLLARASTQEGPTTRLAILRGPPDIPLLRCLFRPPYVCACPETRCTSSVHLKTASSGLDWDMCVGTKNVILFGMGPRMRFLDIGCEIFRWNERTPLHMAHWVSQHVRIGRGVVHISWTQAVWQRIKKGLKPRYEGEV